MSVVVNPIVSGGNTGSGGSGNVVGPGTSTVGHLAIFGNTSGTLLADGGVPGGQGAPDGFIDITQSPYNAVSGADCTTAIDSARAAGSNLWIPSGTFFYNGNGLNWDTLNIVGASRYYSKISIGTTSALSTTKSLVVGTTISASFSMRDLQVNGGFGAINLTGTVASVGITTLQQVTGCIFINYAGAAISHLFSDSPNWVIEDNIFYALNDTTTFGIILSGQVDGCRISRNEFGVNMCHVKIRAAGGSNLDLDENDFVNGFGNSGPSRYSLWILPRTDGNDATPCRMFKNKFGSENRAANDYPILIADENTGSGTAPFYLPQLSADSTGLCAPLIMSGTIGYNNSGPIIYSTTPYLTQPSFVGGIGYAGAPPTYVIQFRTPSGVNNTTLHNLRGKIEPFVNKDLGTNSQFVLTNTTFPMFDVIDPLGLIDINRAQVLPIIGGVNPSGYVNCLSSVGGGGGNTVTTGATDDLGGTDAFQITSSSSYMYCIITLTGLTVGEGIWIEFVLGPPTSGASPAVLSLANSSDFVRRFAMTSAYRPFRFYYYVTSISNTQIILQDTAGGTGNTGARISRLRVYQAHEPIPSISASSAVHTTTAPSAGGASALPLTPKGYKTDYLAGVGTIQVAYY